MGDKVISKDMGFVISPWKESLVPELVSDHFAISTSYEKDAKPQLDDWKCINIPDNLNCISKNFRQNWYSSYTFTTVNGLQEDHFCIISSF